MRPPVSKAILLALVLLALAVRLHRLDDLPAEMWGDVVETYELAAEVGEGRFRWSFHFGGDGPVLAYLVAGLSKVLGLTFQSIKLVTALIGVALVVAVFFYARELFPQNAVACTASFLTAVGFWSLSFSRQGKPHILVPLFVVLVLYFAAKRRSIVAGLLVGLGMWTQAGFWAGPLLVVHRYRAFVLGALASIPVALDVRESLTAGSFFGEKLGVARGGAFPEALGRLLENAWKNALSFHVHGDTVFRHTISGQPHLDVLTGIFFAIGLFLLSVQVFRRRDGRIFLHLLFPLAVIQIPSIGDLGNPGAIPNMGRMIGVMPLAYVIAAFGLSESARRIPAGAIRGVAAALTLSAVAMINLQKYFVVYPQGLPNGNTPFGNVIATRIDETPRSTEVFVVGCCWGDHGQPEPMGILARLAKKRAVRFFAAHDNPQPFDCAEVRERTARGRALVVIRPDADALADEIESCFRETRTFSITENGWVVARCIEGSF